MDTRYNGRCDLPQPLHSGDSGTAVHELQQLLNRKGSHVLVDGTFNASTLAAVISFQQKRGLCVNGQVDEETWQALQQ